MTPKQKKEKQKTAVTAVVEKQPRYIIAPEALAAEGRSASTLALHRRCARCWATLYQDAAPHEIPFEEHWERIRDCCSTQPNYVTPGMPTLEVAFRRLLGAAPEGLQLDELYDAVVDVRSATSVGPSLSPETLRRMLLSDRYYGIREVVPAAG